MRFIRLSIIGTILFLIPVMTLAAPCCKCGTAENPKADICIKNTQGDCSATAQSSNDEVKKLTCVTLDESQCKTVAQSGQCQYDPQDEGLYGKTGLKKKEPPQYINQPGLNIDIPDLQFASNVPVSGGQAQMPFFAQYISAIYKFLIAASLIAAACMFVYGGFLYIVGGISSKSIQRGKSLMRDAAIGLVLVLSAYTILHTINPATLRLNALDITVIGQRSAFDDPTEERGRSEDAAKDKDGKVIKDAKGNLIAQGTCPSDMKAISYSKDYEQNYGKAIVPYAGKGGALPPNIAAKVDSFCIDTYEAPNQKMKKPFLGVVEYEADWYCASMGKRLCGETEWLRACLGPKAQNAYGYGPDYIKGETGSTQQVAGGKVKPGSEICNDKRRDGLGATDATWAHMNGPLLYTNKSEESVLNPTNPKLSNAKYKKAFEEWRGEIARLDMSEPAGSRAQCVTPSPEGVYDLTANAQEIVVAHNAQSMTVEQRVAQGPSRGASKPYIWKGFFWRYQGGHGAGTESEPTCFAAWGKFAHDVGLFRSYENGFRCCMNLDDTKK